MCADGSRESSSAAVVEDVADRWSAKANLASGAMAAKKFKALNQVRWR
jgi:hypothetical protein